MQADNSYYEPAIVHPLLTASLHMDEAFKGFRRDLIPPFDEPSTSDEHWTIWHERELCSRPSCETGIKQWIADRSRPPLDDEVAFYLCCRFDQVSDFLQSLFLADQTTVFSYAGLSLDEFLWWLLVDWWDSHGRREAYFEDLEIFERKRDEQT